MPKAPEPDDKTGFNLQKFRRLLQLMEKYGVTEANLTKDGESWKVRRGPKRVAVAPEVTFGAPAFPTPTAVPTAEASFAQASTTPTAAKGVTIDSPTVGTFYSSPSPDDDVFVKVGSVVEPQTIVCIIEAMKVLNQIPAEKSGRIAEILVENGDAVEFGQPLFRLEPA